LLDEQTAAEQQQNGLNCDREVVEDENARRGSAASAERGGEVVALPKRTRGAPERRAAEAR
jgi:hypothetical protein